MARTILFLIHGVGQRAPAGSSNKSRDAAATWWKEPVDTLVTQAKIHAPHADFGLNCGPNGVKIVPLSYCDMIIEQLERWDDFGSTDVAKAVGTQFPDLGLQFLESLQDISADDAPVFWTKAVDVLLYRAFHDRAIRVHVREQIRRALADNANGGQLPAVAFVAHSLGTAVLHDTLAELFLNPQEFGGLVNMDVLAYCSLANVSKVLQNTVNPHESPVRPFGASGMGQARARRFINVHHKFDPIPFIGMFKPSAWNPATSMYESAEPTHITAMNTHSYVEYLRDPRVWGPLFEAILDVPLSPAQLTALIASNDARPSPPCVAAIEQLKHEVESLAFLVTHLNPSNVWQAIGAFTKGLKAIEDARAACSAAAGGVV
jgi:hypothetical protein